MVSQTNLLVTEEPGAIVSAIEVGKLKEEVEFVVESSNVCSDDGLKVGFGIGIAEGINVGLGSRVKGGAKAGLKVDSSVGYKVGMQVA